MASWLSGLARTRRGLWGGLRNLFARATVSQTEIEDFEAALLQGDVPMSLIQSWLAELSRHTDPRTALKQLMLEALGPAPAFSFDELPHPAIVLVVGVNGSGKTTTSAKLARAAQRAGRIPLLGAADTFRAAGSDQLKWWAGHVDCEVVAGATGADAAAVAFDVVEATLARQCDVAFIDTAGRMHTRQPLMQELSKVRNAIAKRLPGAPHHTWLVLDASLGQNALSQARQFHECTPLSGVVISKLDGSAKAGFLFAVRKELKLPVLFAGLGEQADDLELFNPTAFVEALLAPEEPADQK